MPLEQFNDSGVLRWSSDLVPGGVIADIKTYAASASDTLLFGTFIGRSVLIVPLEVWIWPAAIGVVADTALGYPRVTISPTMGQRKFAVVVL